MELLKIERIEKYYGNKSSLTKAIDGISFHVDKGEFVAIMGASGSGKTTLLNCISTIDRVTSGHIYLEDTDITKLKSKELNKFRREKLGFIFQDFNLLDTLTAYENIALALSIQKYPSHEIEKAVNTVAKQLEITDILKNIHIRCQADRNSELHLQEQLSHLRSLFWLMNRQVHSIPKPPDFCLKDSVFLTVTMKQQL